MSTNEIDQLIREKRVYFVGEKLPLNWYEAVLHWMPLAEAGDAKAQYNIGRCYNRGDGIDKDEQQALAWYLKAAAQNEPRSHFNLHLYYEEKNDAAQAESWLNKAAALGEGRALNTLAFRVFESGKLALGQGEVALARQLFQQAADAGSAHAPYGLVACGIEITGTSITKDTHGSTYLVSGTTTYSSFTTKHLNLTVKNGGNVAVDIHLHLSDDDQKVSAQGHAKPGQSINCRVNGQLKELRCLYIDGITIISDSEVFFPLKPRLVWEKSGPCFVLTACYEDFDAPTVLQFRQFRDNHLTRYRLGKAFIAWYYTHGPKMALAISDKPRTKAVFRRVFNAIAKLLP